MNTTVMFSNASDEWTTPQDVFDALHQEFHFEWDCAATSGTTKLPHYFGPDHAVEPWRDALLRKWLGVCWLNPPYSRCREFIAKAAADSRAFGTTVVCLVPSRTDTRWWHDYVWDADRHRPRPGVEVRFIKGRLKFGHATAGAPFPSVVIVFRPREAAGR